MGELEANNRIRFSHAMIINVIQLTRTSYNVIKCCFHLKIHKTDHHRTSCNTSQPKINCTKSKYKSQNWTYKHAITTNANYQAR